MKFFFTYILLNLSFLLVVKTSIDRMLLSKKHIFLNKNT